MRCPRVRIGRRWLLGLLLLPPLLWVALIAVVPTEWAKARLAAELGRATGRSVRLGGVRLGWLGGVRLRELAVSEPGTERSPWLRVAELRVDLHLVHLLLGRCGPSRVEVDGLDARLLRRRDGTLEFGNLLAGPSAPPDAAASPAGSTSSASTTSQRPVVFLVRGGRLSVVDEPTQTRLEFADLEARGAWNCQRAELRRLSGKLNGGSLDLVAQFDRATGRPMIEGQLQLQGVALQAHMGALAYLLPIFSEVADQVPEGVDTRLNLALYLRGQGTSQAEVVDSLVGHGSVALDPVVLDHARVVAELAKLLDLAAGSRSRLGAVHSRFEIGRGRIVSDPLAIQVGHVPIELTGWTDFGGRLDYRIRHERLTRRLPLSPEAQSLLSELSVNLDDLIKLRVQGTLDHLTVTVDGDPLESRMRGQGTTERPVDDRARMRRLARRLRSRLLK